MFTVLDTNLCQRRPLGRTPWSVGSGNMIQTFIESKITYFFSYYQSWEHNRQKFNFYIPTYKKWKIKISGDKYNGRIILVIHATFHFQSLIRIRSLGIRVFVFPVRWQWAKKKGRTQFKSSIHFLLRFFFLFILKIVTVPLTNIFRRVKKSWLDG